MTQHKEEQMNQALALFYFAYKTFTEKPDEIIKEYGIQRVHHRILFFIARFPGLSINELLSLLEISKQALHGPLRQLLEKGLIESNEAEHDRRVKQLALTKEGAELEKKLSDVQREQMGSIFSKFGESCEENWHQVMNELANSRLGFDAWLSKREEPVD
ncbi:MarR family transcriptional regulator [Bacillus pseudomycoides]|uniref:MarR family transcriptional regulator n=1 Tax=Bacillus pseudomycoides TaxID=64104 RepID=A0AA91VCP6_9BACI|nr:MULTISPECIES: MarR family transcriptional regulator [Bacillus]PEB51825.1 MarR family transcriptional regulator [Bacillus sp. AFS098217]PED82474.1 MarR family transcriptional regulator [Bacillus pseudomycoides]PEU06492.1 MarR family transcriptional regulator [Bacillus sp. AFS019443]PEU16647.1 MarR family transcriptional regulator [Bacillus sp. AFS014408]PFW64011.1 MarR family transcriptional regulator [Bacillus sp. AFS075034]